MAHQPLLITTTIKNIKGELSLEDGTEYTLENLSSTHVILNEGDAAPSTNTKAVSVLREDPLIYTPKSGENLYAWVDNGQADISVVPSSE